ncbi:MAG: hypothetical protein H6553_13945 [Chitinophagales bacterium]|nr:hypothetical protein [Chitinophagales bacterium]
MEEDKINQNNNVDQIQEDKNELASIEVALLYVNKVFKIIKKNILLLILIFILFALYGYKKSKEEKETTYTATMSFILSEETPQISYNNMFINQQQDVSFNNPNKLMTYAFTEKVGAQMLFKKYTLNGKEDYLANHFLKINSGYKESYFKNFTDIKELSSQEYGTFKRILAGIKKISIINADQAQIYYIIINSTNEQLAVLLCHAMYDNIIDYYIERTTNKAKINVDYLNDRLNKISNQLEQAEFNLAEYKDKANNLVTYKAELEEIRQERNKQLLEKDFLTTTQQLELAKAKYESIKPLFQIVDEPRLPLPSDTPKPYTTILIYAAIGFILNFLIIITLFIKKEYGSDIASTFKKVKQYKEA